MTPSVSVASSLSYAPRTVAMRKEANELRKSLKPLLEKRRRARINDSLNRLKALILPLTGKDQCRYSKLEKADILEMTVRFLTDIQSTQPKESSMSFEEGHNSCLQRALATLPQTRMDAESRQRVTEFLQRSVKPSTAACQNCCAQSSRLMSDIHQKLLHLKSSTARSVKAEESISPGVERRRAAPLMADVWRPW